MNPSEAAVHREGCHGRKDLSPCVTMWKVLNGCRTSKIRTGVKVEVGVGKFTVYLTILRAIRSLVNICKFRTTRRYVAENITLYNCRYENLKSNVINISVYFILYSQF